MDNQLKHLEFRYNYNYYFNYGKMKPRALELDEHLGRANVQTEDFSIVLRDIVLTIRMDTSCKTWTSVRRIGSRIQRVKAFYSFFVKYPWFVNPILISTATELK